MRLATILVFASALSFSVAVSAQNLIVDGAATNPADRSVTLAGTARYDHVCVINGGTIRVAPFAGSKLTGGNLELIASSVYVDSTSKIDARGVGYAGRQCYHGSGPNDTAGGRGGCAVADSGGGGAHFGRGGRGTIDAPMSFPTHFEDDCDGVQPNAPRVAHTFNGTTCSSFADCGDDAVPCPAKSGTTTGRFCKVGASVAGLPYWHNIYFPEFGAAGGDKGCRDNDAFQYVVGGSGGGRVVLVGLRERLGMGGSMTAPMCGSVQLEAGNVRIEGTIDAGGKRGCGTGNDSGGGGAGGSVLIVGDNVVVQPTARVSAAGGLGGDTRAANSMQPDYLDCVAGAQTGGTCDDCGGGGGGGIISVLSITRDLGAGPLTQFNVSGAEGGTCDLCKGEAGGGAGELQLDGAYVGEFCDGFDNDFDGQVDEGQGSFDCGLGPCTDTLERCNRSTGVPTSCNPDTSMGSSCFAPTNNVRPRIAVIMDTSASMLLNLAGYPTFGDGSLERPGLPVNQAGESRLLLAREALGQVISAYPEIEFALARYHQDQGTDRSCQTATWFECQGIVGTYDNPRDNTDPAVPFTPTPEACMVDIRPSATGTIVSEPVKIVPGPNATSKTHCINYAGSCGSPRRGADILSGFGSRTRDIVRWLDGKETAFDADATPGDVCKHSQGKDCELRGSGPTPLAGSLKAIEDYITPIRKQDAAAMCRGYEVILVTDGAESCNENPVAAATALHSVGIDVNVVAVSVLPSEQASLNAIAAAGGTASAIFVSAPDQLVPALTGIIAGAIRTEKCDGYDDDCDGHTDEDFPGLNSDCNDGKDGVCRGTGKIVCNGAGDGVECEIMQNGQSPGTEVCNEQDDDCDTLIDEGLTCTSDGCTPKGAEICNGEDDDCDGKLDERDPALGRECGEDRGACRPGNIRCLAGTLQCVGDMGPQLEVCNGVDDDCDGEVDNMAPCPDPTACIEGACRNPCGGSEFSCPVGLLCVRPEAADKEYCLPRACALCRSTEQCIDDQCVDPCASVTCEDGLTCLRGECRDCTYVGCPSDQLCYQGKCQVDACAGVRCGRGELCFNGECKKQCDDFSCSSGEACNDDGNCELSECFGVECAGTLICRGGQCGADPCDSIQCLTGEVCVADKGCVADPCAVTWCPLGTQCQATASGTARCITPTSADDARPRTYISTGGGVKTCSVSMVGASDTGGCVWLCLAALALLLRARKRWLLPLMAALAASACNPQAICLDCPGSNGGGVGRRDAGGGTVDAGGSVLIPPGDGMNRDGGGITLPPVCTAIGDELCNDRDDDCDGRVDEDFDFTSNVRHCGECDRSCTGENAETACEDSECTLKSCLPGFVDLDDELGCEYHCPVFPEVAEDCNGIDDDCDGRIDEQLSPPDPSTLCRRIKNTPCADTKLVCDKRSEKTAWFCDYPASVDFDRSVPNGIDTEERRCDGVDNDCDGKVDEPWADLDKRCDDGKIGACRDDGKIVCAADMKSTRCDLSVLPDAVPGANIDTPELCNGVDDNCDGVVDNFEPTDEHRVRDEMVQVTHGGSSFYIYKFEASRPDSVADIAGINGARACSRAGVQPWTLVSYPAAMAACAASGKRLCTGDEWQRACAGPGSLAYPYGAQYDATRCNGADRTTDPAIVATGSMPMCRDNTANILDLSGNVKEWVNTQGSSAGIYEIRGGSFESPQLGLTCQTTLSQAESTSVLPGLGFRCCSTTAP
jgi:hypothetical protein